MSDKHDKTNYWENTDFWRHPQVGLLDDASISAVVKKTIEQIGKNKRAVKKERKHKLIY